MINPVALLMVVLLLVAVLQIMIYVAICDDDKNICDQVKNALSEYANNSLLKMSLNVFNSGADLVKCLTSGNSFDLIYLDIKMSTVNGIEVSRQIRTGLNDHRTDIVYISGSDGYDRQLFDFQPLLFIAKPIKETELIKALLLSLECSKKPSEVFQYKKGHDCHKVSVADIIYFESLAREIRIVTVKSEDFFYDKLENVKSRVSQFGFLHIHRSYLVNYNHATILKWDCFVMSNGAIIPISRAKRKELRELQVFED